MDLLEEEVIVDQALPLLVRHGGVAEEVALEVALEVAQELAPTIDSGAFVSLACEFSSQRLSRPISRLSQCPEKLAEIGRDLF